MPSQGCIVLVLALQEPGTVPRAPTTPRVLPFFKSREVTTLQDSRLGKPFKIGSISQDGSNQANTSDVRMSSVHSHYLKIRYAGQLCDKVNMKQNR
jgi:hypothetical protein